jgi:hypothetical protein
MTTMKKTNTKNTTKKLSTKDMILSIMRNATRDDYLVAISADQIEIGPEDREAVDSLLRRDLIEEVRAYVLTPAGEKRADRASAFGVSTRRRGKKAA